MKKVFIYYFIIIGFIFSQSENYSETDMLILGDGTVYKGQYLSFKEDIIFFQLEESDEKISINLSLIDKLVSSDGKVLYEFVQVGFGMDYAINNLEEKKDKLILLNGTIFQGSYISTEGNIIFFQPEGYPASQSVNISIIDKLMLSDGTYIIDSNPSFIKKFNSNIKKQQLKVAGGFITTGSLLLAYNTNRECEDLLKFDECYDSIKLVASIGYIFISFGGVLLML